MNQQAYALRRRVDEEVRLLLQEGDCSAEEAVRRFVGFFAPAAPRTRIDRMVLARLRECASGAAGRPDTHH